MTNYRLTAPRIRWGSGYTNALDLAYPLDNATAWSAKRDGSVDVQGPSGVEDSWTIGIDYLLRGDARWIPQVDLVGPPKATGWDGSAGFRAFLEWARDKNPLYFHPDGRNLLVSPKMNVDSNNDGRVDDWSCSTGIYATCAFDSTNLAQKLSVVAAGNTSGATQYVNFDQRVNGITAGEQFFYSVEAMVSGLANGVQGYLQIFWYDANGTFLSAGPSFNITTAASFTRVNCSVVATAPANTNYAVVYFNMSIPANTGTLSAGTIWYRNAVLQRTTSPIAAFIDNPFISSYLLDPRMTRSAISLEPAAAQESDGSRRFTFLLRNTSVPFDGY